MRGIEPYRKLRRIYKLGSKVERVGQELVKPFYGNYKLILVCVIKWWWVKKAQDVLRNWGKRKWKFSLISRAYHLITYFNIKISWVTNIARFWHVFPDFIVSIEDYTLDKIPDRILLDALFLVFRFSKASFNALTSSSPSWNWDVRKVAMAIL